MKLTIDRTKWLRGEGSHSSFLLRPADGKQCCVGIYLETVGIEPKKLLGIRGFTTLADEPIYPEAPVETDWLKNNELADRAYNTNDSLYLDADQREAELTLLFASQGISVEFIN